MDGLAEQPPASHASEEAEPKKAQITIIDYDEGHCEERAVGSAEECRLPEGKPGVRWINVEGIGNPELIRGHQHPVNIEDDRHDRRATLGLALGLV